MGKTIRIAMTGLAAIIIVLLGLWHGRATVPRTNGVLIQEGYVWQQLWTEALRERLGDLGPVEGLVVLAAEVTWPDDGERNSPKRVTPVALDYAALKDCGRAVGLAVRLNAFQGSFEAAAADVAEIAEAVVQASQRQGLRVSELQLDFDCPTSKLAGYRLWVQRVRKKMSELQTTAQGADMPRVVVTVLPSWMNSADFAPLVKAADGFVLQVHSVERAKDAEHVPTLCDPRKSKQWVEQAAKVGTPFRVALPTYAYTLGFNDAGKFVGAAAEGGRNWAAGVKLVRLSANAEEMAELVRNWTEDRPAMMRGVIWYRLPIASDELNWRWETLTAVMGGAVRAGELRVEIAPAPAGWLDVKMRNVGQTDVPMYVRVELEWAGDEPVGRDVLGGFADGRRSVGKWELNAGEDLRAGVLGAGQERTIAWMRFATNREVQAHVRSMDH